jgi:hypothetical protein
VTVSPSHEHLRIYLKDSGSTVYCLIASQPSVILNAADQDTTLQISCGPAFWKGSEARMNKRVLIPIALLSRAMIFDSSLKGTSASFEGKRDQELFLAGALAISKEEYPQARLLLHTLISTYTDSPLVGEARALVFLFLCSGRW